MYFELDENGNPFAIKTNSRSKKLESKIITLFKDYDSKKLKFVEKHPLNRYFMSLIIFEKNKNGIKTSSNIEYERRAIFKGCENAINVAEAKKCFSRNVQLFFIKKFKRNLPIKLGLSREEKKIHRV
jgi:hypothetical protein